MGWGALIQYHFKIDPDTLNEDEFAKHLARLMYALKNTGQMKAE